MAKTDIATTTRDQESLPAYLQGQVVGRGEDNFDASDVVLPRIKLLQGTSAEIQTFDAAKIGDFWHSGMDMSLGTSFRFAIADRRKKYLLMAPIQDGQGILARADDAKTWDRTGKWNVKIKGVKDPVTWEIADKDLQASGLASWGTMIPSDEDSPPAATLFYDYLIFTPDFPELGPSIMSLARSSIRKAKKGLNDKISLQGNNGKPMQSLMFQASSVDDSADGQDYKNWQFQSAGFVQEESLYNLLRDHRGALANIVIQDEAGVVETGEAKAQDTGEGNF